MEDSRICLTKIHLLVMLLCNMKHFQNKIKFVVLQTFAVVLYLDVLTSHKNIVNENEPQLAFWNFVIQLVIMAAIAYFTMPKPKQPQKMKPISLEQFDIPTAEEGRPVQVLFGKKFVAAPNVVWFGHLRSVPVKG